MTDGANGPTTSRYVRPVVHPAPGKHTTAGEPPDSEQGSATAEFSMIAALLVVLFIVTVQIAGMFHVRNTLIDAASTGARFGALEDRTAQDAVERTGQLISASVSADYAQDITYHYTDADHGRALTVTVRSQYPVLGFFGGLGELEVSGHAYVLD